MGRSCIMVESKDTRILLDAGVKLGEKTEFPLIPDSEFKSIDGIVVSHAHLDHSGYLPHIYTEKYDGYTYTIKPTFELTNVLISDYVRISKPDNISRDGILKMSKMHKLVEYHKEFKIKDLAVRLIPAGHILGSAMIEVSDGREKLLYTGDVNFRSTKLLDPAYTEGLSADILVTESTYAGNNDLFEGEKKIADSMVSSINDTLKQGGKVIIPAFAVGRAQETLLLLDDYMKSGIMQKAPIYMDGMIGKAMRIHRHNVIYCRDELQKRILLNDDDPFKSTNFNNVTTRQQRSRIMDSDESCVIVTTSGMITGGPIVKYIERCGNVPKNKLILVGYQASGTKGRQLLEGAKEISFDGKKVKISMAVERFHLSAHADRRQLMSFISKIRGLKNIFIVHGEPGKQKEFQEALSKSDCNAVVPELGGDYSA
ncbi:MAG: MBL fold metallo-hydrolase RNA specificity domain-containing protein [Candidatus Micrarchaeaceae archaeon]